jgi:hypothetical protein
MTGCDCAGCCQASICAGCQREIDELETRHYVTKPEPDGLLHTRDVAVGPFCESCLATQKAAA